MNRRNFCLSAAASMALAALPVKAEGLTGIPGVNYGDDGVAWPSGYMDIGIHPVSVYLGRPHSHVHLWNDRGDLLYESYNLTSAMVYRHMVIADEVLTLKYFGVGNVLWNHSIPISPTYRNLQGWNIYLPNMRDNISPRMLPVYKPIRY